MTQREDADADDWPVRSQQMFLTDLWSLLVDENDRRDGYPSWIESWFRGTPSGTVPDHPTAAALQRILSCGVDPDDLTDVVRTMQHEIIYNACQLLDDPALQGIRSGVHPNQVGVGWELVAVRTAPRPDRRAMGELHSDLDQYDPTGRCGEPRGRPIPAQLPGQPLYARIAVAQARAGDRLAAIRTWRAATGATTTAAKAAIDALMDQHND